METKKQQAAALALRLAENQGATQAPRRHRSQEMQEPAKKQNDETQSNDDSEGSYESEEEYDSEEDDTIQSPEKQRDGKQIDPKKGLVPSLKMNKIQVGVIDGYKSRSARPTFQNHQILATETSDMTTKQGHILLHKNLQLKFLGDENEELRNKVQNLQQLVIVNKNIMSTMLQQEVDVSQSASTSLETQLSSQFKKQLEILEKRNETLEKEQEEAQAQKLVMSQIIQNLKNQEDTASNLVQEEYEKKSEQLDRKEYILQTLELKVYHYEKYLQRKALLETEARRLLNKFQLDENIKDQRVSNVVEDNIALRDEMKDAFKEVNKLERMNIKKKQTIFELKEKIETMKKLHAVKGRSANTSPKTKKDHVGIQEANFDSKALEIVRKESDNRKEEPDFKPVNLQSLSKMAEKFPADYVNKLEVHILQHEHYIGQLRTENDKLTQENNLIKEEVQQNKFLVQQLASALQRSSAQRDLESPGLPQVELADNIMMGDELFDGNMSNIYINPNEISLNFVATNRMDSVVKPEKKLKHRETIADVVDNLKGNTVFNFTKELENLETPEQSPLPDINIQDDL